MNKRNMTFGSTIKRLCILLCLFIAGTLSAQVQFLEESTVTTEGLYFYYADGSKAYHYNPNISPRGDCVAVVNGYIFFGWYKGGMTNRKLMISRKKIGSGNWVSVEFPHRNTLIGQDWGDSHKTISVGVSKIDGTVHIFYDHHNDPLKYIISKKNIAFAPDADFNLLNFEPTRGYLAAGQPVTITYPKITQNDEGEIILNYRKGSAVGGNEMVHVYNGDVWTRSKQVTRGGGIPYVAEEDKNYAYGNPYFNDGNVYYAWSVRWAAKQDLGVLNEGVYLAKCGPDMTSPWVDPNGVAHTLPIQDYSPFLIDLPDSAYGKGSSGGPGLVVSEEGDVHITYDGRGTGTTYEYTYTRTAGETNFTKHTGVRKTGLAWNNRFYTINASGSNITITSGEPGSVNYTTELVYPTGRSFGTSASYIADGKLVLIVSENKQADKKDIYSYVFQLPVPAPVVQDVDGGDWGVASTWDPDGIPVSTNFYTTDLNLHVNNAANPFGGESLRILGGGLLHLRDSVNPLMVTNLIMSGGGIYAGTGNNNTFTLNGNISVVSNTFFQGFWNATGPRNLNILSKISGGASITCMASDNSSTHTLSIGNAANDFSGTWIAQNGTLAFANAGAVGTADITVLDHGKLTIPGNWNSGAMLAVADAPTAAVNLGANNWTVSGLIFGGVPVAYGTYSPAALNTLGSHPVFAGSGTIKVVDPTIVTMDVLGTPETWSTAAVWDNDQAPAAGFDYFVPDTGNLKSPDGESTFDGDTLTVEGGGKLQFRAKHELGESTTVYNLKAAGGTAGTFVNLAAGTGNNTVNHLDGTLENDEFTKLTGYGNATGPRNIRISSQISGTGTLHSTGTAAYPHTCTIANAGNTFAGVWESHIGTLLFESGSAVGSADVTVLATGKLQISDDWISYGTLTVADSATAEVNLGYYDWTVSNLVFGASVIAEGTYTAAGLNALGANAVFTGTGTIRIGEPLPPPVYELIAGWDVWNSATAPSASVVAPNIAASALTTTEGQSWNTIDPRGASIDGSWGPFEGPPAADTATNNNQNLELPNATAGGTITFSVTNNGTEGIKLGAFHFDANAFRSKAARTYQLSVVAGSDISVGTVYTSAAAAINVGGDDNLAHDDIDISLKDVADRTLAAGESVQFLLAFSGGAGDGSGGHDLWVDNVGITGAFVESTVPPVIELIAGWDTWDSATAPSASVLSPGITGTAVTTAEQQSWNTTDERGASNDGDWGTFAISPTASTNVVDGENLTLINAATGGTITFTITNTGATDIVLDKFYADLLAFRPKAPRTFVVSVLAGGGITDGVIYTSGALEIPDVGGNVTNVNSQHAEYDLALDGLADHTLAAGESVSFLMAFSGGAGDGSGGHHLFVDNVGITGVFPPVTEPPVLEHSMSGGDMVFSWTGNGFKVQARTNLTEGIWFDVPGGDTPPVNVLPTNSSAFYRLIKQ